jgi:hypothetical protein
MIPPELQPATMQGDREREAFAKVWAERGSKMFELEGSHRAAAWFAWKVRSMEPEPATAQGDKDVCVDCRDYEGNIRDWIEQLGGDTDTKYLSLELERLIDEIAEQREPKPTEGFEAAWKEFQPKVTIGGPGSTWPYNCFHAGYMAAQSPLLQKIAELEAVVAASHRGPEFYAYTKGQISDKRLEGMIDETKWWKVPGDEVYEVVRELRDSRAKIAELEEKLREGK